MYAFRFRRLSFRLQIASTFGMVLMALIATLSIILGKLQARTVHDDVSHALQVVAHNAQRSLAEGLSRRMTIVNGLAGSDELWTGGLDSPAVNAALAQQQLVGSHLAWMGVADTSGIVRAATQNLLVGANVTARPWFGAGLKGPHVGDVHDALMLAKLLPPSASGEPQRFVDFAAPVRSHGHVVGVLAMHGSWDWTKSVIEAQLPDDAETLAIELFIFDRTGVVLYVPDRARTNLQRGGRFDAVLWLKDGAAQVVRWPNGEDYLTSAASLKPKNKDADLGWVIVARTPKAIAYAPVRSAVAQVALFGGVAALIAMLLAWIISGSISKPLAAIEQAADNVTQGIAGASIPDYGGNSELQRLSTALIRMTNDLETRVTETTKLAQFDVLTGLLNRRGFEQRMTGAIEEARALGSTLSVVVLDIDHFKQVNDVFGHATGDLVLKTLADVLMHWFRERDVVARMGGEEFTILLVDTDLLGAQRVAERLVSHVAGTQFPGVGSLTISCGVSTVLSTEDAEASLQRADLALYRAKSGGRNQAQISIIMEDALLE